MARKLEQAMATQRDDAADECKRREPKATGIVVSVGHGRYIVDYKDQHGAARRFEYVPNEDEAAIIEAEASTRRREVIHG
jgi:hypothetical protein